MVESCLKLTTANDPKQPFAACAKFHSLLPHTRIGRALYGGTSKSIPAHQSNLSNTCRRFADCVKWPPHNFTTEYAHRDWSGAMDEFYRPVSASVLFGRCRALDYWHSRLLGFDSVEDCATEVEAAWKWKLNKQCNSLAHWPLLAESGRSNAFCLNVRFW